MAVTARRPRGQQSERFEFQHSCDPNVHFFCRLKMSGIFSLFRRFDKKKKKKHRKSLTRKY